MLNILEKNSKNLKVGDKVKITNKGSRYSSYITWALKYGLKYWKNRVDIHNDEVGTILVINKHFQSKAILLGVRLNTQDIIIGICGVKKFEDSNSSIIVE